MAVRGDAGMTQVLESMILAFLLLGAAYTVASLGGNARDTSRPRAALDHTAHDALVVLDGIRDANGSVLDQSVIEALHCGRDATPDALSCDDRRGQNLSLRLSYYLPPGAAYAVMLSNGIRSNDVWRSQLPPGEAVTSTVLFSPSWNMTFMATELSCYEGGSDVNLTAIPLANGRVPASATIVGRALTNNATFISNKSTTLGNAWNVSLEAARRPASSTISAETTARGASYVGWTSYGSCDLGGRGPSIVTALRQTTATIPSSTPLGSTATFSEDITALRAVAGVAVNSASVNVYEPVTPRLSAPDSWILAASLPLSTGNTASASWSVPVNAVYAGHPVVFAYNMTVNGQSVQARVVGLTNVALPTGEVPVSPPYSLVLQTWFPDWR